MVAFTRSHAADCSELHVAASLSRAATRLLSVALRVVYHSCLERVHENYKGRTAADDDSYDSVSSDDKGSKLHGYVPVEHSTMPHVASNVGFSGCTSASGLAVLMAT